ncbi:MAG: prolyl oligopeptidase family serine peptidase [Burkholderiaceae bacterium]|nr:prolyl oligopeptidase family serine peptidase [Burkholderiaceae bacterium]
MPQLAPYGSWKSPLSAERAVAAGIGLGDVSFDGDSMLWQESRPAEKGRNVVMRRSADGTLQELNPAPFNARTRVHEYGGRAYLMHGGVLFFSHFADQRLYRVDPGLPPRPITPEAVALRYADLCADAQRGLLWCVREDHRAGGEPRNTLVALQAQGGDADGGRIAAEGHDFYAAPRLSPDGTQLAWLSWNHPDMPWDGCELWLADVNAQGRLQRPRRLAGSRAEAVQQPQWSPDGHLHFISDRSGWCNLYRWGAQGAEALCPMDAEFGQPFWNFGLATYAFASATQLVCCPIRRAVQQLAVLDTASLQLTPIATPFSSFGNLAAADGQVLFTGASPLQATSVGLLQLHDGRLEILRRGSSISADPDYSAVAEAIEFPSAGALSAHAFFYAPRNRDFQAPAGEKPPLVVMGHGGPTSMAANAYRAGIQYWTSRGFAVLDVNYGGSSGFGRAYRQRLDGAWGVVDVMDCIQGARYLVARGDVDGRRLIIRGGSAGGYTTLSALAFHDTFACGASLYGIGDLETLAKDTHKFEARYLDRLVGPWPAARELYLARSPIHHLDGLQRPLILLQGAEDAVVPPEQSRRMHAALKAKGVPVAYLEFEGEQHGFRDLKNIVRALEAEAFFYARVFGFTLADPVDPVPIDNL